MIDDRGRGGRIITIEEVEEECVGTRGCYGFFLEARQSDRYVSLPLSANR